MSCHRLHIYDSVASLGGERRCKTPSPTQENSDLRRQMDGNFILPQLSEMNKHRVHPKKPLESFLANHPEYQRFFANRKKDANAENGEDADQFDNTKVYRKVIITIEKPGSKNTENESSRWPYKGQPHTFNAPSRSEAMTNLNSIPFSIASKFVKPTKIESFQNFKLEDGDDEMDHIYDNINLNMSMSANFNLNNCHGNEAFDGSSQSLYGRGQANRKKVRSKRFSLNRRMGWDATASNLRSNANKNSNSNQHQSHNHFEFHHNQSGFPSNQGQNNSQYCHCSHCCSCYHCCRCSNCCNNCKNHPSPRYNHGTSFKGNNFKRNASKNNFFYNDNNYEDFEPQNPQSSYYNSDFAEVLNISPATSYRPPAAESQPAKEPDAIEEPEEYYQYIHNEYNRAQSPNGSDETGYEEISQNPFYNFGYKPNNNTSANSNNNSNQSDTYWPMNFEKNSSVAHSSSDESLSIPIRNSYGLYKFQNNQNNSSNRKCTEIKEEDDEDHFYETVAPKHQYRQVFIEIIKLPEGQTYLK